MVVLWWLYIIINIYLEMPTKFNLPTEYPLTFLMLLGWLQDINSKVNWMQLDLRLHFRLRRLISAILMNPRGRKGARSLEAWRRAGWGLRRLSASAPGGSWEHRRLWSPWWRDRLRPRPPAPHPAGCTMATRLLHCGSGSRRSSPLGYRGGRRPHPEGLENVQPAIWHRTAGG